MNKLMGTMLVIFFCGALFCSAQPSDKSKKEYIRALTRGAKTKATLVIADEEGSIITNATVTIGYLPPKARNYIRDKYYSDSTGTVITMVTSIEPTGFYIEKEGYYGTSVKFRFGNPNNTSDYAAKVNNGRWLPWNPTIQVLLKKVHSPTTMVLSYEHVQIKSFMEPHGFDLKKHDWVSPLGKGEIADVFIKFLDLGEDVPYKGLVLEFVGDKNGAYVKKKDNFSVLKSDYHASTKDIYERIISNTEGKRGSPHVLLGVDDYLVFRVRSKLDAEGKLVSAFYGKIYGPFDYFVASRDKLRLITFFNPVENDTNLEFDGVGYGDGSLFGR